MLIKNIKSLVQVEEQPRNKVCGADMNHLNTLENSWLLIEEGVISDFGSMNNMPKGEYGAVIDASGRFVLPSFCDSHTHLVYAGSREQEFIDKLNGLSYQEIARRGGGILHSMEKLAQTSEEELFEQSVCRAKEIIASGTGAVEIKSGYGPDLKSELNMLRVAKRIGRETPLEVKTTFLGAHAVPKTYSDRKEAYVQALIHTYIPEVADQGLADYIDVFCEEGFFSVDDTDRILNAGIKYGLRPKVHANQLSFSGGVQVGVKHNAISVDHLESTDTKEFKVLKNTETMPVALPGASFFLNMHYAPVKKMIDYGLPVALASNYNPGSCPSGDMKFILSLACIKMKLNTKQAINAATLNGAYAMGLSRSHGSIAKGKIANLFITQAIPSLDFIPYAFNAQIIDTIILKGKIIS
ncbi:MAG: imidazolonepropionase [Bacteroidetes bacterium]|nr:imidazolonepropionase [Bacteroidota bacterium]